MLHDCQMSRRDLAYDVDLMSGMFGHPLVVVVLVARDIEFGQSAGGGRHGFLSVVGRLERTVRGSADGSALAAAAMERREQST